MRTAVVVVAHDGLISQVTGVGVIVNSFIESFDEISKKSNYLKERDVKLFCLATYLKETSLDFNPKIKQITENACELTGGKLVSIPTFSDGSSQNSIWCGPPELNCYIQWSGVSLSVASYLLSFKDKYEETILFTYDTIFASIRKYCPDNKSINIIWIPHSLGRVFEDEFSDVERLRIEESAIKSMIDSKRDFIGYIGKYFKDKLKKDYKVDEKFLLPFINGLYKNSARFSIHSLEEKIKEYKIPSDKKLIFSWGRCVLQKGYDLLIPAYNKFFKKNKNFHLVLLMPTETSNKDYLSKIMDQVNALPKESVTAIYKFDNILPKCILSHANLDMVIIPSRFEGSPITPLETLSFVKEKVKIIYSPIPPLKEVFEGDPRTVQLNYLDSNNLLYGMNYTLKKIPTKLSMKEYDIVKNYCEGIDLFGRLKDAV